MVRLLFVMLLPLGHRVAVPAKMSKTLRALDLCAPRLNHDYRHPAFIVWAALGAPLYVQLIKDLL